MQGEASGLHAISQGSEEPLLAGDVPDRNAFGGIRDVGPGQIEQDGAPLSGDPDVIEAQLGGQGLIPRRGPQLRGQVVEPVA